MHRVELRRLVVGDARDAPQRGIRVPGAAVVELHIAPQLEDPALLVGGIGIPFGGEARCKRSLAVRPRQIPVQEAVVEREADEALPLRPLVRMPRPIGDVARGHRHPQDLLPGHGGRAGER
jgi:hypothetical protein